MKSFKSLAEFKRVLAVGDRVKIVLRGAAQPETTVTRAQSNCFAVERTRDGKKQDSWVNYPKAANAVIENDVLIITDEKTRGEYLRVQFAG